MAVHRYVNSAFWDSDDYTASLSPTEKLVFLYLLTNSHTSIAGVYELPTRTMIVEIGLDQAEIDTALSKFQGDRKVYRFKSWIVLCNFPRHQKWEQRVRIRQGIEAVLKKIPSWLRCELEKIPYTYPMDKIPIGYPYHPNGTASESESESETESESEGECEGGGYPQAPPTAVSAGVESPAGRPGKSEADPDAAQDLPPSVLPLHELPDKLRAATERARARVEADAKRKAEHTAHATADYRAVKQPVNGSTAAPRASPAAQEASSDFQPFEEA